MPLTPGSRWGGYEITQLLGEGGMGEVYRARDSKLGRDVAIKVVSAAFATDAQRLARFDREARLLAALNHPNVATVYGFEDNDGVAGLVLELVPGGTLADRLSRGPIPVSEALAVARQIADALEAAHEKGIVHRDLKPANVKLAPSGAVKVLDFGLAKAVNPGPASESDVTLAQTAEGIVLGTVPYMSPEQACGRAVDRRTDVWAFGCVLYEMLAGRRPFAGSTQPELIGAILQAAPDWRSLPAEMPPGVARLLRRCLEKDPQRRLRDVADARLEIDEALSPPVTSPDATAGVRPRTVTPRWVAPAAGALVPSLLSVFLLVGWLQRGALVRAPVVGRFHIAMPAGENVYLFTDPLKLSPDGRRLAIVTQTTDGRSQIRLRSLDSMSFEPVAGSDGAAFPFWSADGRSLAFLAEDKLKAIDLASHSVRTLAPAHGPLGSGAWSRDGVILFSEGWNGPLKRIAAEGGEKREVTALDPGRQERFHGYPQFLPDGRHFLYFAKSNLPGQSATFVGALDGAAATKVLENESRALFAAPGHLLYVRNGQLMAHRFDPDRRRVSGDPTPVADRLWGTDDFGAVTVSESSIAYAAARPLTTQLSVVDRNGKPVASIGEPGEWVDVDVAPDERRLAAERLGGPSRNGSIFVADIGRGTVSRLTTDPSWNLRPVWSPDGARIVFASGRSGAASLYVRNADGSGADEPLVRSPSLKYPNAWIADGRVIYTDLTTPGAGDVLAVPADPKGSQPSLVAGGPFHQTAGRVSSDGKWLAFQSDDSGRPEVYVKPLNGSGRTQVSLSGGILPLWRRDSAELYFLSPDKKVMATPVVTNPTFSAGRPAPLFDLTVTPDPWRVPYGVLDSGSKFVVIRFVSRDTAPQVEVLVNWTELVAKPQAAK